MTEIEILEDARLAFAFGELRPLPLPDDLEGALLLGASIEELEAELLKRHA